MQKLIGPIPGTGHQEKYQKVIFDVVLNPGHTYYPDIDENNAACGNLILTEDASLGITTSGKLSVSKSMFIQSPLALLTFSNGTLELEYNLNLTNTNLTLTDFILTVNNNMNLYSGTTLILNEISGNPTGLIIGNVNVGSGCNHNLLDGSNLTLGSASTTKK